MSTSKYHIAIIGPTEIVSGFNALGIDTYNADSSDTLLITLRHIKSERSDKKEYAVVCVIESLLRDVDMNEYNKIVNGPLPAVVSLPGPDGSTGFALDRLRSLAERAVGSSII
jgi:V/A-type H+/Na+-transporting ATPase subunit F